MIHIESMGRPLGDPELASRAAGMLRRAHAMGLLEDGARVELSVSGLKKVLGLVGKAGIGREAELRARMLGAEPLDEAGQQALFAVVSAVMEALDASPVPASEWRRLTRVFEPEQLARLLDISPASVRRYLSSVRETPDDVAARLHFLALVSADLAGAYNEIGLRRWFERKRSLLGDRSPGELLRPGWTPEDPGPAKVRELARSLTGSPAT